MIQRPGSGTFDDLLFAIVDLTGGGDTEDAPTDDPITTTGCDSDDANQSDEKC